MNVQRINDFIGVGLPCLHLEREGTFLATQRELDCVTLDVWYERYTEEETQILILIL